MCDLDNLHDLMTRKNDEHKETVGYYSSLEKRKEKNESKGILFERGWRAIPAIVDWSYYHG